VLAPGDSIEPRPAPPGRFRRAIAALLGALGGAALFLSATVVSIGLHANLPPSRRLLQRAVNDALRGTFQGKVVADEIAQVSLGGVKIRGAEVLDPEGRQVIRASGIHARADVLALARDLLFGRGELRIGLSLVRIDDASVQIEPGPDGSPTLAQAFVLREAPPPPEPGDRAVRIALPRIEIGHAWVHGPLGQQRRLDADVQRLVASLQAGPEGVAVRIEQTGLTDPAVLPEKISGSANAYLRVLPAGAAQSVELWTEFAGQLGQLPLQARALLENGHLSGKLEIPRATPAELTSAIPGLPVRAPLAATLELDGDVPTFSLGGRVTLEGGPRGDGLVTLEGLLDVSGPARLEVDVNAVNVDVHAFTPGDAAPGSAPEEGSLINASGRLRAELGELARLSAEARTDPFSFEGNALPAADVHLVVDRGRIIAMITAHEPGMPTSAEIVFTPSEGLRFGAVSDIVALREVPRFAAPIDGSAHVQIRGTLQSGALDARVSALVGHIQAPGDLHLDEGGIEGRIVGRADALSQVVIDASMWGRSLRASGYRWDRVSARAVGPWLRPRLEAKLVEQALATRDEASAADLNANGVEASGELDPRSRAVRGLKVRVRRDGAVVDGSAARVEAAPGGALVRGIHLAGKGIGKIDGDLRIRGKELSGKLQGEGVDVERIAALVGLPRGARGIMDFDVALEPTRKGRRGHVQWKLENGQIAMLSGVAASFNASFDDDRVKADGAVQLIAHAAPGAPAEDRCDGSIAAIRFEGGEGSLPGPLLDARSWAGLSGKVNIATDAWDLRCLARIPPVNLLLSDVRGTLTTRFTVDRPRAQRFPSIRGLEARTHGLAFAAAALPFTEPAWESHGIDVQIKGGLDGATGRTEATVMLSDGGLLGDVDLLATLDLPVLWDQPKRRWSSLRQSKGTVHAALARRSFGSFASLPTFLQEKLPPLSGEIRTDAYLDGSLDHPFIVVRAAGWDIAQTSSLGSLEATDFSLPIDVTALATYEDGKVDVEAQASYESKEFLAGNGQLSIDLPALAQGRAPPSSFSLFAKLTEAPLGAVPLLDDRDVGGHLSGTIAMSNLHDRPTLHVELTAPDLQIGPELFFNEGELSLDIAPSEAILGGAPSGGVAKVLAKLVDHDGGRLDASAFAGLLWENGKDRGIVPTFDPNATAALRAKATKLRLSALYPLVAGTLSKLDGYLDGEAWIDWNHLGESDRGKITARMKVTEGVFHVPQLGQEFHDAAVAIENEPDGTLRFRDFHASGLRGRVTGSGSASFDGLVWNGADAALSIAPGDELPITLEGAPFGSARGELTLHAAKLERKVLVDVGIPYLHFDLPAAATRAVQSLEDTPGISVSHAIGQEKEPRSADALTFLIRFNVDRIDLAGTGVDIRVRGSKDAPPRVELTDRARVSGDINVLGGSFEVIGKRFEIERGLVRLRPEDASNPYINLRARWDSSDARVFVDYAGVLQPITDDKLRLSSDPPRPKAEILSLLAFGGEQYPTFGAKIPQANPAQSDEEAARGVALGVGGGFVSQQFNALISGIAPLRNFSTQFSTAENGSLRPGLAYTLGDKLHVVATYDAGLSSTSSSPTSGASSGGTADPKTTSHTELNLDWRFLPNWLLRGSFIVGGEQSGGTGLDLFWQYRY
jgi:translocation and assembly module TamB